MAVPCRCTLRLAGTRNHLAGSATMRVPLPHASFSPHQQGVNVLDGPHHRVHARLVLAHLPQHVDLPQWGGLGGVVGRG